MEMNKYFNKLKSLNFSLIMQGIIIILGITLLWQSAQSWKSTSEQKIAALDSIGSDSTVQMKVVQFDYHNHKFLEINRPTGNYIVHDPNCKCMSTKLNNIVTVMDRNNQKNCDKITETTKFSVNANIGVINNTLKHLEERMANLEKKCQPKVTTIYKFKVPATHQVVKKPVTAHKQPAKRK